MIFELAIHRSTVSQCIFSFAHGLTRRLYERARDALKNCELVARKWPHFGVVLHANEADLARFGAHFSCDSVVHSFTASQPQKGVGGGGAMQAYEREDG